MGINSDRLADEEDEEDTHAGTVTAIRGLIFEVHLSNCGPWADLDR